MSQSNIKTEPIELTLQEINRMKFFDKFDMEETQDVKFDILNIEELPIVYDMQFDRYTIKLMICKLTIDIIMVVSRYEKTSPIRKLTISNVQSSMKEELAGCLNHLQRKRDLKSVMEKLELYNQLHEQRQIIGKLLMQQIGDYLSVRYDHDKGYVLSCEDKNTGVHYFEATWKVFWNCRNHLFFDYINFSLNTLNIKFYYAVTPIMTELLKPSIDLQWKRAHWMMIAKHVQTAIENSSTESSELTNIETLENTIVILDSESEDEEDDVCFVDGYILV